jgi:hypothetical protein
MATAAERRASTVAAVERWHLDGDPRADAGQADIDFRDQFPLEIGWGPNATVDLARGELYPTLDVHQAMRRWLACEQGKIAACPPGSMPPPEGVLRPGELATAGAAAAAPGEPPPPQSGVVLPADVPSTPSPATAPSRVPWWVWPAAVGAGVLVFILAVGRRKVA